MGFVLFCFFGCCFVFVVVVVCLRGLGGGVVFCLFFVGGFSIYLFIYPFSEICSGNNLIYHFVRFRKINLLQF